jgi:hypothetical protein
MSMPGFSAEASLYSRRARYQARATLAGPRQAGEIIPSRRTMDCDWDSPDDYCCLGTHPNGAIHCCYHPSYGGITCAIF